MSTNSTLKDSYTIDQRKASFRQRSQESSCARKKTIDTGILLISRTCDRKIV